MRYFFNIYVYFSLVFLFFIKHFVLIFLILQELQGDFFICFIYINLIHLCTYLVLCFIFRFILHYFL